MSSFPAPLCSMENISVHVRVRPLNAQEREKGNCWHNADNRIFQIRRDTGEPVNADGYALDNIFGNDWSTAQVSGCALAAPTQDGVQEGLLPCCLHLSCLA